MLPAVLATIWVATRLPYVTHWLWEWDSALYARALEQAFHVSADLGDQPPHPPGYVFYVAAAGMARTVFGLRQRLDTQRASLADGEELRYVPSATAVRLFGNDPIAREP